MGNDGQHGEKALTRPAEAGKPARRKKSSRKVRRLLETYGDEPTTLLLESGAVVQMFPTAVTDSLRYMVARLRAGEGGEFPARVGVTSAIRGEGVSFIARALATVLADGSHRVCLVDANWWAPTAWPDLGPQADGFAQVLLGWSSLDAVLVATGNPGLFVLPAGPAKTSERIAMATGQELDKLLVELGQRFDHVIVDLPAVRATSEALTLSEKVGAVALVINQGVTPQDQVRSGIEELGSVPVLGAILNRCSTKVPERVRSRFTGI